MRVFSHLHRDYCLAMVLGLPRVADLQIAPTKLDCCPLQARSSLGGSSRDINTNIVLIAALSCVLKRGTGHLSAHRVMSSIWVML